MKPSQLARFVVVVLVVAAVVVILVVKQAERDSTSDVQPVSLGDAVAVERPARDTPDPSSVDADPPARDPAPAGTPDPPAVPVKLPKLLDLGADKCIHCKKMAPILVALREDFAGRFDVVFVDVWKNRQAAVPYGIKLIPTQIFFAEDGKELFRHQGFYSRADILGKWAELGYAFTAAGEGVPVDSRSEAPASDTAASPLQAADESQAPVGATTVADAHQGVDKVIAYYFHWTTRCQTCLEIEQYSRNVMIETFGDQLEADRLEWHAHNMEQPEYEHFQTDFELSTASLVLVRLTDGAIAEWKVLGDVWKLIEVPQDLQDYVETETRAYLDLASSTERG
ncbi:MAG: nitrophenyl compound nitroreductase subunit ArsF family protein [Planctomycetota bacterium]|jgi:thioredoxin 1